MEVWCQRELCKGHDVCLHYRFLAHSKAKDDKKYIKTKKYHELRWEIQSLTLLSGHCLQRSFLIKKYIKRVKFGYLMIIIK